MPSIDINDMGSIGLVRDQPPHQLQPEAWDFILNARILDASLQRLRGKQQILIGSPAGPPAAPLFALHISSSSSIFWLVYTATGVVYAFNGASWTSLGPLAAVEPEAINATILGGVPIINNGSGVPQFWGLPYSVVTPLASLTNWPATLRAKIVRAFGPYLIAMNTTDTGTGVNTPHRIRWSHPADPGSLPISWDITDPTKDAGQIELPDVESGVILDGLGLQGRFYVYKQNAVWRMRPVKGRFIFDQEVFLETIGILSTRCVDLTADGMGHVFAGQDNIWMHDGNKAIPLLDAKMKRSLFASMDPAAPHKSFLFTNPAQDETWFCYAETGSTVANKALIIKQKSPFQCVTADIDFVHAAKGVAEITDSGIWSAATYTWDSTANVWGTTSGGRRVIVSNRVGTKMQLLDAGSDNDGVAITATVQRTGLSVVGRKRNGEWIVDFQQRKLLTRVWPKVTGGAVMVRAGSAQTPDGAVTWQPSQSFDPTTQHYVDFITEGPSLAIEFSGTSLWKLDGYKIDLELTGHF